MTEDKLLEIMNTAFEYGAACKESELTDCLNPNAKISKMKYYADRFEHWKANEVENYLMTSEQVISEAEKHFAELTEPVDGVHCKPWLDWRSFYTGYTDGRIKGFE